MLWLESGGKPAFLTEHYLRPNIIIAVILETRNLRLET